MEENKRDSASESERRGVENTGDSEEKSKRMQQNAADRQDDAPKAEIKQSPLTGDVLRPQGERAEREFEDAQRKATASEKGTGESSEDEAEREAS